MAFSDTLAAKMEERQVSVRKLAATWRPATPESARRNLYKYLAGQEPSERIAAEIAEALDVPVHELTADDDADDEEADPVAMLRDVMAQLDRLLTQQSSPRRSKRRSAA